jgi:regulator of protease activity HflC (stomatin/prohibitin superfamily)
MIKKQRDQTLQTEVAKQNAIRANQDKLTAEAEGLAAVMKVKYQKEQEKQAAVTDAEKEKAVASLMRDAAEFTKKKLILEGEGEAEKRKLIMSADGALEKKLEAYKAVQQMWSEAFSKYSGQIVPTTVMGGSVGGGNGATNFMEIMTAKAARDLSLDLSVPGKK